MNGTVNLMQLAQKLCTHVVEGAIGNLEVGRFDSNVRKDAVAENYTVIISLFPTIDEATWLPFSFWIL